MADTITISFSGENFNIDQNSYNHTSYNSSTKAVTLNKPGDLPYIEYNVTNGTGGTVSAPVIDIQINSTFFQEFGTSPLADEIASFAVQDTNYNVLYYWVYDGDPENGGTLISDYSGDPKLDAGYYIRVQLKKVVDDTEISIANTESTQIRIIRYAVTSNAQTTGEPTDTTDNVTVSISTTYHPTGTWTSPVIDLGEVPIGLYFEWTATEQSGTRVDVDVTDPKQIEYRTSSSLDTQVSKIQDISSTDNVYPFELYPTNSIDNSAGEWQKAVNGIQVPSTDRYIQFRVTFIR